MAGISAIPGLVPTRAIGGSLAFMRERGTEIRHIALDERHGATQVILPVYRTNQMGVMRLRSEADLVTLKAQAAR